MDNYLKEALKKCGGLGRKETRVRQKNAWIIETCVKNAPEEWLCTILPPGKRVLAVRYNNKMCIYDRHQSPSAGPIGGKITRIGPDFVADTVEGYFIFDVLAVDREVVTNLTLPERLAKFPEDTLFRVAQYLPFLPHVSFKPDDLYPNKRLLIVKPQSPYMASTKDAITWKQPYAHTLAVLCCRLGKVCAVADDAAAEFALVEEGDLELPPTDWDHEDAAAAPLPPPPAQADYMKTYLCRYNSRTCKWAAIKEVKRSEPIYTAIQTLRSIAGLPQINPVFG